MQNYVCIYKYIFFYQKKRPQISSKHDLTFAKFEIGFMAHKIGLHNLTIDKFKVHKIYLHIGNSIFKKEIKQQVQYKFNIVGLFKKKIICKFFNSMARF